MQIFRPELKLISAFIVQCLMANVDCNGCLAAPGLYKATTAQVFASRNVILRLL